MLFFVNVQVYFATPLCMSSGLSWYTVTSLTHRPFNILQQ